MDAASFFAAFWRVARPLSLLAGILLYALGGGIANYLGYSIDWTAYWLGQAALTALQLSSYFLREYFDRVGRPLPRREEKGPPDAAFLQIAATALTAGAVLTVLMLAIGKLNLAAFVFLGVAVLLSIAYAVPPMRLVYSGYGELVMAILMTNLFPSLAYLLQVGELHRLLAMLTFPLTFLYLAGMLARSLQSYMEDLRHERSTMLLRMGWQRGMNMHNLLVLLAYFLLAAAMLMGLPWQLALPGFLSLPVAMFQVWQIAGIANGAKPRWRLLSITTMATVAFAVYFLNLALWIG